MVPKGICGFKCDLYLRVFIQVCYLPNLWGCIGEGSPLSLRAGRGGGFSSGFPAYSKLEVSSCIFYSDVQEVKLFVLVKFHGKF